LSEECDGSKESLRLVPGSVKLQWTAFKTTEKLGVSGSFTSILVEAPTHADSEEKLLSGISFSIDGLSVASGNPERDRSLKESFFALLKPNANIDGDIKEAKDGKAILELRLNGKKALVPFTYVFDKTASSVVAKGKIDMLEIGLDAPFAAIHERCTLLHTGADGVSKTWTDVELEVSAKVNKACAK
jgi:hypothetical protein